jgi:MFS family permease
VASAFAPSFTLLVMARMIGGLGVGISLIIAPMYIAELAPPEMRGRMVSFNQLNIVLGISVAFFTNYLILQLGESEASWAQALKFDEYNWRWMLGLEAVPAILYFFALFFVPRSPRWLAMKGKYEEAMTILCRAIEEADARRIMEEIRLSLKSDSSERTSIRELLNPSLRFVLLIGLVIGVLQQITGINSVFFYAPMIFEQSGIGTDASFSQAIMVGVINLVFTILAMSLIDRLGRKPLLVFGVSGMAICLFMLAYGFGSATYELKPDSLEQLSETVDAEMLTPYLGQVYESDIDFKAAMYEAVGKDNFKKHESQFLTAAVDMNAILILIGILGFVASFAVSIGPVMWVLFSELFPNWIRGLAISFVGLVNSAISFLVQLVFPWELEFLGSATTFAIYASFALLGLLFIILKVPETKGKSLEELEIQLVGG